MRRVLQTAQAQEVIARYLRGEASDKIAAHFGVSQQTVYNVVNRSKKSVRSKSRQKAVVAARVIKACSRGASVTEAALAAGVSARSVSRIINKHRAAGEVLVVRKGRPSRSQATQAIRKSPAVRSRIAVDPEAVSVTYARIREIAFPFPEHVKDDQFYREVGRLRDLPTHVTSGGLIEPRSPVGVRLCSPFFPNRYKAASGVNISAFAAWSDEKVLKDAISFQLRHGDSLDAKSVLRAVTMKCRTPTIFRPGVARYIYKRFCPPGGRVWDPCAGFGGRLLGAFAAGVHYTGTDVDIATVEGNRKLAERLGANYDVIVAPAETFNPPKVNLVFTSPPYFDRERYSDNEKQTWKRYGESLGAWLEGFLRPVIERARAALSADGHLILNIADLKQKGKIVPLVSRTIALAVSSGFDHVKTLHMPLAAINRLAPTEPVLVFKAR